MSLQTWSMDLFGLGHLALTPFEIASKKVSADLKQYTSYDLCFLSLGIEKNYLNISNTLIYTRSFYKFLI